jgi:NADH:ubiquinone oxidoreductase subunit
MVLLIFIFVVTRWVVYNPKYNVDYDGSMVPAEWFGWLHYKTDKTPLEKVGMTVLR